MATVNPTVTRYGDHTVTFSWALTNADADGAPVGKQWLDFADRNFQVKGTLGGASVHLQGSNDGGTTWFSLDDPQGTNIELAAAGGKAVSEVTRLTRPLLVGGAGSSVTAILVCRRARAGQLP